MNEFIVEDHYIWRKFGWGVGFLLAALVVIASSAEGRVLGISFIGAMRGYDRLFAGIVACAATLIP